MAVVLNRSSHGNARAVVARARAGHAFGAWMLLSGVLALVLCGRAQAQHVVEPGRDWSRAASQARPGDVIVLAEGVHRPAMIDGLEGTPDRPIVIRGTGPDTPARIDAARSNFGLMLRRPRHVVIQDIVITGAAGNGVNIDDGAGHDAAGEPWPADLTLRRVAVERTGPRGNTDGIKLSGLRAVRIEDCRVEGWGGSAIDMVGCHEVSITGCTFKGLPDHDQSSGVQAKGGSSDVRVVECRFENAGQRAVNLGGSTGLPYFRPAVPADAAPGTLYEAENIIVERCVIVGGDCAVAFVNSRGGIVRRCTISGTSRWVFRLLHENNDPRFGPSEGGVVENCLVIWRGPPPRSFVNVGPGTSPDTFRFGTNLWWWAGAERRDADRLLNALPGMRTGDQRVFDPQTDDQLLPAHPDAQQFGAGSRESP
jgi:hypothetical protein